MKLPFESLILVINLKRAKKIEITKDPIYSSSHREYSPALSSGSNVYPMGWEGGRHGNFTMTSTRSTGVQQLISAFALVLEHVDLHVFSVLCQLLKDLRMKVQ